MRSYTKSQKGFARLRWLLQLGSWILSILILLANANMISTFNNTKQAGREMHGEGGNRGWWKAWPYPHPNDQGLDLGPNWAYLSMSAVASVVMTGMIFASFYRRVRYLESIVWVIVTVTWCVVEIAGLIAISVIFNFTRKSDLPDMQ
jgi:hypothetical protein